MTLITSLQSLLGLGVLAQQQSSSFWLPVQGSSIAPTLDKTFYFIYWISVFFFILISVLMFTFVIKYRVKEGEKPAKKVQTKATKKGAAKAKPAKKLTEEEKKQQKMMGYMIMMWAGIGSVMLSQFIPTFKYADSSFMAYLPIIITVPAAAFYVTQIYWKK